MGTFTLFLASPTDAAQADRANRHRVETFTGTWDEAKARVRDYVAAEWPGDAFTETTQGDMWELVVRDNTAQPLTAVRVTRVQWS